MKKAFSLTLILLFFFIKLPAQQELVDSLKKILPTIKEDTTRVIMLGDIAFYLYNLDPIESFDYAKKTLELAQKIDFGRGIINGYYKMCIAKFGETDYVEAEKYALLALEQAEKLNYDQRKSPIFNILGVINKHQGNYQKSIEWGFESERIARKTGDDVDVGVALNNIGVLYLELNDTTIAKKYFLDALEIMEAKQQKHHLVEIYTNLEPVEQDTGKRFFYISRAIELAEEANYNNPLAYNYNNLANFYKSIRNDSENAETSYRKALYYVNLTGDNYQKAITSVDFGDFFLGIEKIDSAKHYLFSGLDLAQKADIKLQIIEAKRSIAQIYKLENSPDVAYDLLMESYALNDSLYNKNIAEQLAIANTRFETEKKEAQIAQQQLQIVKQENIRNRIIMGGILILLIGGAVFQWYYNRQRRKKKEAELELELRNVETENLKALDKLKTSFFTNISHELRTPLTLISSPLEYALGKNPDNELRGDLELAHKNSKKLLTLINEILDLSKLQSGKLKLNESKVQINKLLRRIFLSFQSLANLRQIELDYTYRIDNDLLLSIDVEKFEKIINNLVSNAIKFSDNGGKVILDVVRQNKAIKIAVIDSGSGIHPDDLPRVFERFFQSNQKSTSLQGGTGVGLALAKELSKLFGAELTVQSKPGKGSTFVLLLPQKLILSERPAFITDDKSEEEGALEQESENITYNPILINGEKPQILIVEDNKDMSDYLVSILSTYYRCSTAIDGQEAIKKVQKENFDLITSDVMMPRLDGFGFKEKVNKMDGIRQIPFIMLTARALEEDMLYGLSLGVDDYITKPFKAAELLARISNLLKNRIEREQWLRDHSGIDQAYIKPENAEKEVLKEAERAVLKHIADPSFKVIDLANKIGYGERQLRRTIKKLTGFSPVNFILEIRMQKAYSMLESRSYLTVSEVRYEVGIESASYFSTKFRERFGRNPKEFLE